MQRESLLDGFHTTKPMSGGVTATGKLHAQSHATAEDRLNHNNNTSGHLHVHYQPPAKHRTASASVHLDDDEEDEYENDSELGDDLHIDDAGNVLYVNGGGDEEDDGGVHAGSHKMLTNTSTMAHILAGYGTDICEQLIAEFIKLELNAKQLSALTDADLEMLGVRERSVRAQMLAEFAELPNQDFKPRLPRNASEAEKQRSARQSADLVLSNVYKHLNSLKASLSVVLLRLYVRPTENVLINDHTYASEAVLRTLDEFNRSVVGMEKRLLDMQYGNIQSPVRRATHPPTAATGGRRRRFWFALVGGLCSIGSVMALRYMHMLKR